MDINSDAGPAVVGVESAATVTVAASVAATAAEPTAVVVSAAAVEQEDKEAAIVLSLGTNIAAPATTTTTNANANTTTAIASTNAGAQEVSSPVSPDLGGDGMQSLEESEQAAATPAVFPVFNNGTKKALAPKPVKRPASAKKQGGPPAKAAKIKKAVVAKGGLPPLALASREGQKGQTALPATRIKTLMRQEISTGREKDKMTIAGDSILTMAMAAELFLKHFAQKAFANHTNGHVAMLNYSPLADAVAADPSFSFLQALVPQKVRYGDVLNSTEAIISPKTDEGGGGAAAAPADGNGAGNAYEGDGSDDLGGGETVAAAAAAAAGVAATAISASDEGGGGGSGGGSATDLEGAEAEAEAEATAMVIEGGSAAPDLAETPKSAAETA